MKIWSNEQMEWLNYGMEEKNQGKPINCTTSKWVLKYSMRPRYHLYKRQVH